MIVMALVMVIGYLNRSDDGVAVAKRLAAELTPLLDRGDVASAAELIKSFADENRIRAIKLSDAGGGAVLNYSVPQSQDEFALASVENAKGFIVVDWPLYSKDGKIGRIELMSNEYGDGGKYHYFAFVFLLIFGLYVNRGAFNVKPFIGGFGVSNSMREREHSRLFLNGAFEQMGLTIHFGYFKKMKNEKPFISEKYCSVRVKWMRSGHAEYFSLSQISELMSKDAMILPIMPWLYREFLNKHPFRGMGDVDGIASFDVSAKQFLDDDFRRFIVELAASLSVSPRCLRIDVDEVALSRLGMDDIHDAWLQWSDAGIGVVVSNFGKTSLSKRIIDNFNPKEVKWCLSWLRYQNFSGLSKDRIINLKHTADDKGIVSIVYGALAEHDEALMHELNFDWLDENVLSMPGAASITKTIPPSYSIGI